MAPSDDPRYPAVSRPVGDFGPSHRRAPPACPPAIRARRGEIHLLCPRPLHHFVTFGELFRLAEEVRRQAPAATVRVWLRSALEDASAFARLPVDGVETMPAASDREGRQRLLARVAGRGQECILLGASRAWSAALREARGVRLLGSVPLGWRLPAAESETARAAGQAFLRALRAAAPRWTLAPETAPPLDPGRLRPARFLVHQARFHAGDVLWLTPLLRALGRAFPGSHTTVVGPKVATRLLAGNSNAAEVVTYEPAEDPDADARARRRVLQRLALTRFDAALFAFARRPESRWLAEAAAAAGVPRRINLEYFDPALDHRRLPPWLTHEGWFFWGAVPSAVMLRHAVDPLGGPGEPWTDDDRRVEFHVTPADRRRAERLLAARGIRGEPFAVLAPGGRSSRRWPAERFAALAARLAREEGLHVLVEGHPSEKPLLDAVAAGAAATPRRVIAAADPLGVFAALLERATLLVSNDNAAIHLAEAVGAPTLYFAQREKLVHSHPGGPGCWAVFDEVRNDVGYISVTQVALATRDLRQKRLAPIQKLCSLRERRH